LLSASWQAWLDAALLLRVRWPPYGGLVVMEDKMESDITKIYGKLCAKGSKSFCMRKAEELERQGLKSWTVMPLDRENDIWGLFI
jgi:hypothetical protein